MTEMNSADYCINGATDHDEAVERRKREWKSHEAHHHPGIKEATEMLERSEKALANLQAIEAEKANEKAVQDEALRAANAVFMKASGDHQKVVSEHDRATRALHQATTRVRAERREHRRISDALSLAQTNRKHSVEGNE